MKIRKGTARVAACWLGILLALAIPIRAANPDFPNGPDEDPRLAPPDDPWFPHQYQLHSHIPDAALDTIRPEEIPLGAGVWADRAYQVTLGDPRVVIAVLDSGIHWDSYELRNRLYINRGEVPLPQGSADHDANGDGAFDIRDYAGDPRVLDANGNAAIEPGDLIRIFSDGVDDDGNGYVDDIAGWDFFRNDNDPADDTGFGHGTGEAEMAAAETNNGAGGAGVCPRCRVLPVRVSDSFVADANPFAQGVVFAVDSGAQVILEALGTLDNTPFARDAVEYAIARGASIAASAADENSFHHNYPAAYPRTIQTNNVLRDDQDLAQTTTFMALDACTNWGPKTTVSASSYACSSGATGIMGGALGMIYSRAIEIGLDPPLSSAEVFSLVAMTAIDIYDPRAEDDPTIYPSRPGWDKYFGHGRLNVRAAVDRVAPGTIPPEAYIESPGWFELVDPRAGEVEVRGYANARRAPSFEYRLEAAAGLAPEEGDWSLLGEGDDLTAPVHGVLGVLSPDGILFDKAVARDVTEHFAVLLRLTVTDALGNEVAYHHSFFLYADPDWAPGFPKSLNASGEGSPLLADLTGDRVYELIVPTAEGLVHVYRGDGTELPGWPAAVELVPGQDPRSANYRNSRAYRGGFLEPDQRQAILAAPAAADLDGDGVTEVVAATIDGQVWVWAADGEVRAGFPVEMDFGHLSDPHRGLDFGFLGAPMLADLSDPPDGRLEIVAAGMDQYVYAWHDDGEPVAGWPVLCQDPAGGQFNRIVATPALGDLNGDGRPEIVVGTNEHYGSSGRLYAIHADGNEHEGGPFLPGWPAEVPTLGASYFLPFIGEGIPTSAVLADFDGDGADEVVINAGISVPQIFDGDGTLAKTFLPFALNRNRGTFEIGMGVLSGNYAIADLGSDGRLVVIKGGEGAGFAFQGLEPGRRIPADHLIGAWRPDTGLFVPGWPRYIEDVQLINGHAVADISGDGLPEIITGSGGHYVHAYDIEGREPPGWPKFTGGWILSTPTVGDMDGDGYLEVAVATREGSLFVWRTRGRANNPVQWTSFAHDARNTGNHGTELPWQFGPPYPDEEDPWDEDPPAPGDDDEFPQEEPTPDDADDGCGV